MAHLTERLMSHYRHMVFGYTITTAPDVRQLAAGLAAVHPTRFFAVPRIYEKLGGAAKGIANADETLRAALGASLGAGGGGALGGRRPGPPGRGADRGAAADPREARARPDRVPRLRRRADACGHAS